VLPLCAEATSTPLDVTQPLHAVLCDTYDAIFIPGGHGVMWDMVDNSDLANLIAHHYESGRIVSSVCHGPAAFANVKLKDSSYMVKNKKVRPSCLDFNFSLNASGDRVHYSWLQSMPVHSRNGSFFFVKTTSDHGI
jgi:putative intracellular protease/amidase